MDANSANRLRQLVDQLTAVKHYMDNHAQKVKGRESCPLLDEKKAIGVTTPEGDLCRLQARAQYLLDILVCELFGQMPACCKNADKAYCDAFELCPP